MPVRNGMLLLEQYSGLKNVLPCLTSALHKWITILLLYAHRDENDVRVKIKNNEFRHLSE